MKSENDQSRATSKAAIRNISRIEDLEASFEQKGTHTDRFLSTIADWAGSLSFIFIHAALFMAWIVVNTTSLTAWPKFDPYPFSLLGVLVACEAVILSTIVLVKQNWMGRMEEHRDQIHLQINLLAEQEVTKVLFLQRLICQRLGIQEAEVDPDVEDLSQETAIEHLAKELRDRQSGA